jgi:hypothetical protein
MKTFEHPKDIEVGSRVVVTIEGWYGITDKGSEGVVTNKGRNNCTVEFYHLTGENSSGYEGRNFDIRIKDLEPI